MTTVVEASKTGRHARVFRQLHELLHQRILIFDGAMGTALQAYDLDEDAFRGQLFTEHPAALKGCNDLLSITQPAIVREVHSAYLSAGADCLETNTFNATAVALADYELQEQAYQINLEAARLARQAADQAMTAAPSRPRFVAGSMGPTNRTASMSPDVNDPGFRNVTFEELEAAYYDQARGLIDGGVDILMPETTFDTLNLKAALFAIERLFLDRQIRVPVIASLTIVDQSGRTLSGQTVEAFWNSISHIELLAVAINCALGPAEMRPYVEELSHIVPHWLACIPNAGLPNEFGEYDESPADMARVLGEFGENGWLNFAGGCCGSTAAHVEAIAETLAGVAPREVPEIPPYSRYSGLEPLTLRPESNFTMIGERTNITGSRKFARLIKSGDYEAAVERSQYH